MARLIVSLTALLGLAGFSCTAHRPVEADRAVATTLPATRPMPPLTRPASLPAFTVTEMQVQTLPGGTLLSLSEATTWRTVEATTQKLLSELRQIESSDKVVVTGPPTVIYHDAPIAAEAPFMLEIGLPVPPGATGAGSAKIRTLAPMTAATVMFTGPLPAIDKAYDRLVKAAEDAKQHLAGETREIYLHRGAPDALDTQVLIGIAVR